MNFIRKKIVFFYSNEPEGLTTLMINSICVELSDEFEIHILYMQREGSELTIPFSTLNNKDQVHPIIVHYSQNIISKVYSRLSFFFKATKYLTKIKPDIIQVSTFDLLAYLVIFCKKNNKYIFDLRDTYNWMHSKIMKGFIKWLLSKVKVILITSPKYESLFLKKLNLINKEHKIIYIPNVPDQKTFQNYQVKQADEYLVIGYIGYFRNAKEMNALFDAIIIANTNGYKIKGYFAGVGIETDLVKTYCNKYEYFHFAGPYDYINEISKHYSKVDLIYTVYDNSYNKKIHLACRFAEAMICGLPVIVRSDTYMAELVQQHKVGFSLKNVTKDEILDLLINISNNRKSLEIIKQNCQNINSEFKYEKYKSTYLNLITSI